jgi:hypothetical protein
MGRYVSDELFHFVGRKSPTDNEANYQVLKKVLSNGYVSHPPHTPGDGTHGFTIDWSKDLLSEDLFIPTVVCFCDIPVEHLAIHMQKYGQFGLSLPRNLLARDGARPVIYIPRHPDGWRWSIDGRSIVRNILEVYRGFNEHLYKKLPMPRPPGPGIGSKITTREEAIDGLSYVLPTHLIAFIKTFHCSLGDEDPNNFYMEREWRKFGCQKFEPANVGRVLVASGFESRLSQEMPEYSGKIEAAPRV